MAQKITQVTPDIIVDSDGDVFRTREKQSDVWLGKIDGWGTDNAFWRGLDVGACSKDELKALDKIAG